MEAAKLKLKQGSKVHGCGSKLNRGVTQVLVHVSIHQGSILVPVFEPQPHC